MATPANRVPVRIARGTKANLDTAISAGDLKEGEICYAADENSLYVVEGGVLTLAGEAGSYVDPLTTDGDLLVRDTGTTTRLGVGTDDQVLTVVSGQPAWADAATGGGGASTLDELTDVDLTVGGDPYFADVAFLLNSEDGTEGGAVFTDASPNNAGSGTVTGANSGADVTTKATSAKYGNYGVYCTPDVGEFSVRYPLIADYNLGEEDWTVEWWFNAADFNERTNQTVIGVLAGGTADKYRWAAKMVADGGFSLEWSTDGAANGFDDESWSGNGTDNVWHHYAIVNGGYGSGTGYNVTELFPADSETPCTIDAVTGIGEGATTTVFSNASGGLSFFSGTTTGQFYEIGDQIAIRAISGPGEITATVARKQVRAYFNGNIRTNKRVLLSADYPSAGDVDNELFVFGGTMLNGTPQYACEGSFDDVRITKFARYVGDSFTPGPSPGGTQGFGDGAVLTYDETIAQFIAEDIQKVDPGLPEYVDNAAATTGGLAAGDLYRTSDGTLKVVY